MSHCIYVIRNTIDGKAYVGKSRNFAKRRAGHIHTARSGKGSYVHAAMRKHGVENFKFEVIEECAVDVVDERERHWIAELDTFDSDRGYNLTIGGDGTSGWCHSHEARRKISEALVGHYVSDDARRKMSDAKQGHVPSEETRQKISTSLQGRTLSNETRSKMSDAQRRCRTRNCRTLTEETRQKISRSLRGRTVSDEHRRKISEAQKRRWACK